MFRYMVCGKSNGMFSTRWKRTKLRRLKIESLDPILWRMLLLMMFGHIFVGLQNKLYNNFFCLSPLKSCVCIKPLVCSLRMLSPSCYESSASLQTPSYWSNGLYGNNHLFFFPAQWRWVYAFPQTQHGAKTFLTLLRINLVNSFVLFDLNILIPWSLITQFYL